MRIVAEVAILVLMIGAYVLMWREHVRMRRAPAAGPRLNGRGKIRLTLVTNNMREAPVEFDTDDLGEALAEYGRRHFAGGPPNSGPDTWVVAFVVENGDARMSRGAVCDRFNDIAIIERSRAARVMA